MKKELRVAILGYNFMGRAHSNAWLQAPRFFNLEATPVLQVACGRNEAAVKDFAQRWGWKHVETDWRKAVERDDVDAVDIALPRYLHHDAVIAAARAGKHLFCEKPLALTVADAQEMLAAAEKARVTHYLNHNYRRVPAVALARRFIEEGKIGRVFHWRGAYQQDWLVDPNWPLSWKIQKETAGTGPHGDLNSHSVDLARYLVGEIRTVSCAFGHFIRERPLPDQKPAGGPPKMGPVTVEDASLMQVEFESGALGSFEATRFATGRKNRNSFEIYGSEGSVTFDMERMNELEYFSRNDPAAAQGFRRVLVTDRTQHPYVGRWWPPGHIIGYEHTFVHAVADFVDAVAKGTPIAPNFRDGLKCVQILAAGEKSAATGQRVAVG